MRLRNRLVGLLTLAVSCIIGVSLTWAATITATSCSRADVLVAVNVAVDGDTVVIPAGSCTYTTQLTITNKILTLQGAGVGATILTDATNKNVDNLLEWTTKDGAVSRITGITFQGNGVGPDSQSIIEIQGEAGQFRFDHSAVIVSGARGMTLFHYVRGVIDHNTFDVSSGTGNALYIHNGRWAMPTSANGDASWAAADSMGTSQALFVEDNIFTNNQSVTKQRFTADGWQGGRVVYRFNTFTNTWWTNHGTESSGRLRSQRQFEVYNNTFSFANAASVADAINIRGGTGVIFNNTITLTGGSTITNFVNLTDDRSSRRAEGWQPWGGCGILSVTSLTSSGTTATATTSVAHGLIIGANVSVSIAGASPLGYNGTFKVQTVPSTTVFTYTLATTLTSPATGTITSFSPWDQNSDANGYLCLDQPGAGMTDLLSGFDPTPVGWPHQVSDPIYGWNNVINGVPKTITTSAPLVAIVNRDFFDAVKLGYTPFTYPHPLTLSGSPPDTTPPTVPAGLTATAVSFSQINLSWSASTDAVGVTGYKVFRGGVQIAAPTGTSFLDTGLTASTAYSYTVSAFDAAGNESSQTASVSATTLPTPPPPPDTTPPSVPTGLSVATISSSQITSSWTASTDNVGVTGYRVYRDGVQISSATTTSFPDSGLSAGTTYSYTVAAFDGAGNVSTQSAGTSATTLAGPPAPPPAAHTASVGAVGTLGRIIPTR